MDNEVKLLKKAIQNEEADIIKEILQLTPYRTDLLLETIPYVLGRTGVVINREANSDPTKRGVYARKWEHTPTRTIRVPTVLADDILMVAHDMDLGIDYKSEIKAIIVNHEAKKKGYYGNNISELIADLKAMI